MGVARRAAEYLTTLPTMDLCPDELEERLFPFWEESIHEVFKGRGICPCQTGSKRDCFLTVDKQDKIEIFGDDPFLSFENFKNMFTEALNTVSGMLSVKKTISED